MMNRHVKRFFLLAAFLLVHAGAARAQDPEPQEPEAKRRPTPAAVSKPDLPPASVAEINKGRGRLFIKEANWDFGHVVQDAQVSHVFTLENVGDDTLFIERIKPT